MPSADELAANYPGWWCNYIGNPDLDPEQSKACEGGLDFSLASLYFSTEFIDDWRVGYPAPVIEKGSFSVANLTIAKKIVDTEDFGDVPLKAEIENLFDKNYEYVNDYPMPGRSFFLGLRYVY